MYRTNAGAMRRNQKRTPRRRKRGPVVNEQPGMSAGGCGSRWKMRSKVMLLACMAIAVRMLLLGGGNKPAPANDVATSRWPGQGNDWINVNKGGAVSPSLSSPDANVSTENLRARWKREAGWESVADEDLEEWVPLGPDPPGCLPRAPSQAQPAVMVGWGFGSTRLTLYAYRALESLLHVYPGARVKFITVGPRYAFFYKWANVIAFTQFQKYTKRGYDVKVEIYFGGAMKTVKPQGRDIPGSMWWYRHKNDLLYGMGMDMSKFQAVQDAIPAASTTLFFALLELYKNGGIYVDLTTFFVRPLPPDLEGFVVGGDGPSRMTAEGVARDCSLSAPRGRRQRALVMQYPTPRHPVVECALAAYDKETSVLNECLEESQAEMKGSDGGLECVLETLEACTKQANMKNSLRDAGVVDWRGCDESVTKGYSKPASYSGFSGGAGEALQELTGLELARTPPPGSSNSSAWLTASIDREAIGDKELLTRSDDEQDGGEDDETGESTSGSNGSRISKATGGGDDDDSGLPGVGQEEEEEEDGGAVHNESLVKGDIDVEVDGQGRVEDVKEGGDDREGSEGSEMKEANEGLEDAAAAEEETGEGDGMKEEVRGDEEDMMRQTEVEEKVAEEGGGKEEREEEGEKDLGVAEEGGGGDGALVAIRASESELDVDVVGVEKKGAETELRLEGHEGEEMKEEEEMKEGQGDAAIRASEPELDSNLGQVEKGDAEDGLAQEEEEEMREEQVEAVIRASGSELDADLVGVEEGDVAAADGGTGERKGKVMEEGGEVKEEEDKEIEEGIRASESELDVNLVGVEKGDADPAGGLGEHKEGQAGEDMEKDGEGMKEEGGQEVKEGKGQEEMKEEQVEAAIRASESELDADLVGVEKGDADPAGGLGEHKEGQAGEDMEKDGEGMKEEGGQEVKEGKGQEEMKEEQVEAAIRASESELDADLVGVEKGDADPAGGLGEHKEGQAGEDMEKDGEGMKEEGGQEVKEGKGQEEMKEEQVEAAIRASESELDADLVGVEKGDADPAGGLGEHKEGQAGEDMEKDGEGMKEEGGQEVKEGKGQEEMKEEQVEAAIRASESELDADLVGVEKGDADPAGGLGEHKEGQAGEDMEKDGEGMKEEGGQEVKEGKGQEEMKEEQVEAAIRASESELDVDLVGVENGDAEGHGEAGVAEEDEDEEEVEVASRASESELNADLVGAEKLEADGGLEDHGEEQAGGDAANDEEMREEEKMDEEIERRTRRLASKNGGRDVVAEQERQGAVTTVEAQGGYLRKTGEARPRIDRKRSMESSRELLATAEKNEEEIEEPGELVSLMWLGPEVSDGFWKTPEEGSVWGELFSRLRLTRWKPQQVSAACRQSCGHWDTTSSNGKKAMATATAQAGFQCAPSVFVPGTQKGASTFLFHAIAFHPQVVHPLRGAHGFKETGRYVPSVATGPHRLHMRLAAFPFIEEHENIITGDGTVTYMVQGRTPPEAILADNPHAKVVFALRDPVARAWSDFRFLWNSYAPNKGFGDVVESSLKLLRECFEGHDGEDPEPLKWTGGGPGQLILSEKDEKGVDNFYSGCSFNRDPGQIVRKGIYYYQVLHWVRVFGSENVMIVDSADLKARQKETIEEVYDFLGLCSVDLSKFEPENVTPNPQIPEGKKINAKTYQMLQEFYEPFNRKLYSLLGRDLGWEKNTFKKRRR